MNHGNKLYGRMIQHVNPLLCTIGAMAFYFFGRFTVTGELDDVDFSSNEDWFDMKVLSDHQSDNTKIMSDEAYSKSIKKVLNSLGIFPGISCTLDA